MAAVATGDWVRLFGGGRHQLISIYTDELRRRFCRKALAQIFISAISKVSLKVDGRVKALFLEITTTGKHIFIAVIEQ